MCAFSLPVYVAGPSDDGEAPEASGADEGHKEPALAHLRVAPGPETEAEDEDTAGLFDFHPEVACLEPDGPVGSKAVRFRARFKRPETPTTGLCRPAQKGKSLHCHLHLRHHPSMLCEPCVLRLLCVPCVVKRSLGRCN